MKGKPLRLFDAHCHLQDDRISVDEAGRILEDAASVGVSHFAVNGCFPGDWDLVDGLVKRYSHDRVLVANYGLHPWWIGHQREGWIEDLRTRLKANPRAGLGECGIDKGSLRADMSTQLDLLRSQLLLAQELQRCVSIHCVRAHGRLFELLKDLSLKIPIVLHSWSGSVEMVKAIYDVAPQALFSFSGAITRMKPDRAIPIIRAVPDDCLVLESDAPDGHLSVTPDWVAALGLSKDWYPQDKQSLNVPSTLGLTLEIIARARDQPVEDVAYLTWKNTCRAFRLEHC